MAKKVSKDPPRKPRTDALRNRERILEVAKEAFGRSGADASLDDIAKQAEVGAGTLYRHFPTREALIELLLSVWISFVRPRQVVKPLQELKEALDHAA